MKFTIIMFGGPLLLVFLALRGINHDTYLTVGSLWFVASIPLVGIYWIARVVRMAWRQGTPRTDA